MAMWAPPVMFVGLKTPWILVRFLGIINHSVSWELCSATERNFVYLGGLTLYHRVLQSSHQQRHPPTIAPGLHVTDIAPRGRFRGRSGARRGKGASSAKCVLEGPEEVGKVGNGDTYWLVVSNMFYFPFHIYGIILPIDSYFSEGLVNQQPAYNRLMSTPD